MIRGIIDIVVFESKINFRNFASIASLFIFVFGATFVSQKCFVTLHNLGWIALFWILFMFTAMNAILHTFENTYYHSKSAMKMLFPIIELQLGKILYNSLFLLLASILLFGCMTLFFSNPFNDLPRFLLVLITCILGVSCSLHFIALLTLTVSQSFILFSLLSIPLMLPFILISVKLTSYCTGLIQGSTFTEDYILLSGLCGLSFGAMLLLSPYLWKT